MKSKTPPKFSFIIMTIILTGMVSFQQKKQVYCLNPSGFKIMRGVNLSHWLSQDFGWEPKYTYINEKDIRFIDSIGYDHVRIPIDEQEMWDEIGNPIPEAFAHLTRCLDWCAKYNLRAIVDLHIIRAHNFNASNEGGTNILWTDSVAQKNFIDLWVQLSGYLHKYSRKMVAYEILNEAVAPNNEDWNKLMNRAVAAIRKLEPKRVLIIGANMWQIASNLKYLRLPEGDKNIILSFHTYTPMAFTHYKADWVPVKFYKGPVHYPGQIITTEDYKKYVDTTNQPLVQMLSDARDTFNRERLIQVFQDGLEFAKSKNLQLYCGEFGCMPTVDRKDRLAFYNDMISALEENNIAWCNWEYKGDFGIYFFDAENKTSLKPDFDLIKILLKNSDRKKIKE
jgi:endoglucanase